MIKLLAMSLFLGSQECIYCDFSELKKYALNSFAGYRILLMKYIAVLA